jgi:hypothetical protein
MLWSVIKSAEDIGGNNALNEKIISYGFMKNNEKIKCSQCLKKFLLGETDTCDECGKDFCVECLTYHEEAGGELAFCSKCKK